MSVKPIDIQVNIGKLNEVGRIEHAKMGAIAEQQKMREDEAHFKSALADKRMDETAKGERTSIKEKEKERGSGGGSGHESKDDENDHENGKESLKDDRAGRIIDLKR